MQRRVLLWPSGVGQVAGDHDEVGPERNPPPAPPPGFRQHASDYDSIFTGGFFPNGSSRLSPTNPPVRVAEGGLAR